MTSVIVPPVFSRGKYLADLDSLDVENRPEWQPGYGGAPGSKLPTHCNQAAKAGCDKIGVPLPGNMLANDLQLWLAGPLGD